MLLYNCSMQQHSGSLNSLKSHWHSLPIKWNVQSKEEKGTSEHTIKRIKRGGGGPRKRKDLKSLSLIMPCSCINWKKKSFSPIHVNIQISLPFEVPSIDDVKLKSSCSHHLDQPAFWWNKLATRIEPLKLPRHYYYYMCTNSLLLLELDLWKLLLREHKFKSLFK